MWDSRALLSIVQYSTNEYEKSEFKIFKNNK